MSATETARRAPRLEHRVTIPVLGIPVTFESNDPTAIGVAEDAFAMWRVIEQAPRLIADTRMSYRIFVEPGDEGDADHAPLEYRSPDEARVVLRTPGSTGLADAARREAVLWTTPALVADRQHFRYGVIEALTLAVLTRLDRQPVHAACITRADTALLLAGPSGTGKSTLAYAAARAGYAVLSEDYVNIQLEPRLRVWGMPGWLHLPVEAAARFPELQGRKATMRANGKEKIAINLAEMGATPSVPVAQRAGICILEGGHLAVSLETLESAALMEAMTTRLDPGFDVFAETIGDCIRLLARHGGWRLRLSDDPEAALPSLAAMFDVLTGG